MGIYTTLPAQNTCGVLRDADTREPLSGASFRLLGSNQGILTDAEGRFCLPAGPEPQRWIVQLSTYRSDTLMISLPVTGELEHLLTPIHTELKDPITVTAFAAPISLAQSPVLITRINALQLESNISATLTDALLATNGLTERVACGVCGTNELQINGLGGAATLVLIDGMPLMGSLASIYGLSGLPPALIDRVEVIKGPASTLYGTESIGGVLNVITRQPHDHAHWMLESWGNTHGETQLDATLTTPVGRQRMLLGVSGYHMGTRLDANHDNFMDVVLARRLSVFNKWQFARRSGLPFQLAGRVYAEDRSGGTLSWRREYAGSDVMYGEFILTRRAELLGQYTLHRNWRLEGSLSGHDQRSWYGHTAYLARQYTSFTNLVHTRRLHRHDLSAGATFRYQYYRDNTPATAAAPDSRPIPGIFLEDMWRLFPRWTLQGGLRVDHHRDHGLIPAPRLNLKWDLNEYSSIRLNGGSGFRVVNLFTEDHAALSGSRTLVIEGPLNPERSWSGTASFSTYTQLGKRVLSWNLEAFHTYYTNRILPDYSDDRFIRYTNLDMQSVTQGLAVSANLAFGNGWRVNLGATWLDTWQNTGSARTSIPFAPSYTTNWTLSYQHPRWKTQLDYTGKLFGPMALPHYPEPYTRATSSPVYSQQHLQCRQPINKYLQVFGGVKNLLNWTQSDPLVAPEAPFGDAFDTAYVYGPLQGRRFFAGIRLTWDH
ncbi:MAG: TonB-dependent receptor [Bacteroidetes bacterium]|nr:TonB-dependent receptor [Bacteroidota bacterium]